MLILNNDQTLSGAKLHSTVGASNGIGITEAGAINDFIRIRGDRVTVKNCEIFDKVGTYGDHFDGTQLTPIIDISKVSKTVIANSQYAAALIKDTVISGNHYYSKADMQGVFMSDGCASGIIVTNNTFDVRAHNITLNGVIDGVFRDNRKSNGNRVPLILNNLRIGGAPKVKGSYHNLWVKSFKGQDYEDVEVDSTHNLRDGRGTSPFKSRRGVTHDYLIDFDRDSFITEIILRAITNQLPTHTQERCKLFQKLARDFSANH